MNFHSYFHLYIRRLYYSRIIITGVEHVPSEGPLLVICLHRNGAVDGFVYREAVSHMIYLVRAKLRKGLMGRLFFPGLDVVRRDDGGTRAGILAMIEECSSRIGSGDTLCVFPEGTSDLGPRHLPFRSGAVRIAEKCINQGVPLTVLPMGIHYERPWAFRSRTEIVVGKPVALDPDHIPGEKTSLKKSLSRRFTSALEDVGINVADKATQELLEKFAYIATLGTGHEYFSALKVMEKELPPEAVAAWTSFEEAVREKMVLKHQGVPLFPMRAPLVYALLTLLLGVPVLAGALLNFMPITVAWYCGRRFSDGLNVVALWRIMVGVPSFIVWQTIWIILAVVTGQYWVVPVYFSLTFISVMGWYRLKKLAVASWNGLFHSNLRVDALSLHKCIIDYLEGTGSSDEVDT
jgi:1-acyl-sn-glycerol-3-phosphate acyltransferase